MFKNSVIPISLTLDSLNLWPITPIKSLFPRICFAQSDSAIFTPNFLNSWFLGPLFISLPRRLKKLGSFHCNFTCYRCSDSISLSWLAGILCLWQDNSIVITQTCIPFGYITHAQFYIFMSYANTRSQHRIFCFNTK